MAPRDEASELVANVRVVVEVEPATGVDRPAERAVEQLVAAAIHRALIEADVDQRLETELRRNGLVLGDLDAIVTPVHVAPPASSERDGPTGP
jgi:hypothetical protein